MKLMYTIFLLFIMQLSIAQAEVYYTYSDFKNDRGEKYDKLEGYVMVGKMVKIAFIRNWETTKIKTTKIWGFKYKNKLFRIDPKEHKPCYVASIGNIVYYENGLAHLNMLIEKSNEGTAKYGAFFYFSKTINDEMIPWASNAIGKPNRHVKKFFKENPEYNELFECIKNTHFQIEQIRQCVFNFEN